MIELVSSRDPERDRRNELRAADSDRDAVVERLRDAAAEGRLEHVELDARVEQALTAKTYADLAALTADLPPEPSADPGEPLLLKGGLHGAARTGRWQVPAHITIYGGMGGARLDFTRTATRLAEVEVEAHGQWAGVTIVIPDSWCAETGGLDPGIGGLRDKTTPDRLPGTPLLRLTGTGGTAGITIRHPNTWERHKLRRNQPSDLRAAVCGRTTRSATRAPDRKITVRQPRGVSVQQLAVALIHARSCGSDESIGRPDGTRASTTCTQTPESTAFVCCDVRWLSHRRVGPSEVVVLSRW